MPYNYGLEWLGRWRGRCAWGFLPRTKSAVRNLLRGGAVAQMVYGANKILQKAPLPTVLCPLRARGPPGLFLFGELMR